MKTMSRALGAMLLLTTVIAAGADETAKETTSGLASETVAQAAATATFEALDKNADRQISRTEAAGEKALADGFASVDTNGDGYVDKAEYIAAHIKSSHIKS